MFNIKWNKDQDYSNCYTCLSHFNLLLRKHHCRKCGKIFCIKCLKKYTVFNKQHYVCQNCIVVLNELIMVDKTELYNLNCELTNLRDFFNQYIKRKKNNSTQTVNISNSIYTQTNNINKIDNTTQTTIDEFKSKSLDILDCINTASKKTQSINYSAEKEILKYQENKNKSKLDKKIQEEKKYKNELENIHKDYNY